MINANDWHMNKMRDSWNTTPDFLSPSVSLKNIWSPMTMIDDWLVVKIHIASVHFFPTIICACVDSFVFYLHIDNVHLDCF
jgi:hypothetical protein